LRNPPGTARSGAIEAPHAILETARARSRMKRQNPGSRVVSHAANAPAADATAVMLDQPPRRQADQQDDPQRGPIDHEGP